MATAHNGDIELYYDTFGFPVDGSDDPAIICIPGMGSQCIIFADAFCHALVDRGFFVLRMDNRDVGLSTKTDASLEYTLSDMAADVTAVLDAAGVHKVVVLGMSLGGMVAQQTAIDHPDRLRALVSVASSCGDPALPGAAPEIVAALVKPGEATIEAQIESDIESRRLWSNPDWFDADALRGFFAAVYERQFDSGGGLRQYAAVMRSPAWMNALRDLDVPTLVVHGENDTLVLPEHGRRTAELIPGADYLEIDGFAHDFVYQMWPPLIEATTALTARTFA